MILPARFRGWRKVGELELLKLPPAGRWGRAAGACVSPGRGNGPVFLVIRDTEGEEIAGIPLHPALWRGILGEEDAAALVLVHAGPRDWPREALWVPRAELDRTMPGHGMFGAEGCRWEGTRSPG